MKKVLHKQQEIVGQRQEGKPLGCDIFNSETLPTVASVALFTRVEHRMCEASSNVGNRHSVQALLVSDWKEPHTNIPRQDYVLETVTSRHPGSLAGHSLGWGRWPVHT